MGPSNPIIPLARKKSPQRYFQIVRSVFPRGKLRSLRDHDTCLQASGARDLWFGENIVELLCVQLGPDFAQGILDRDSILCAQCVRLSVLNELIGPADADHRRTDA